MKIVKSIFIFVSLVTIFGACFNPPDISDKPQISFEDVSLYVSPSQPDSLVVTITFKDGNGDLGLDSNDSTYSSDPFNERNYFIEKDGELVSVPTSFKYSNLPPILKIPAALKCATCKLATVRTIKKPAYSKDLKPYVYPNTCLDYFYTQLYVQAADTSIFDQTFSKKEKIKGVDVYSLVDTFYYKPNPNYFNFDIDFLLETTTKEDSVFDWRIQQGDCGTNFYGRFPVLSDQRTPLEGTLRYDITSSGIVALLGGKKKIKLRVTIRDRALHVSNTITSSQYFQLSDITKYLP